MVTIDFVSDSQQIKLYDYVEKWNVREWRPCGHVRRTVCINFNSPIPGGSIPIPTVSLTNAVTRPKDWVKMANSVDPDQPAWSSFIATYPVHSHLTVPLVWIFMVRSIVRLVGWLVGWFETVFQSISGRLPERGRKRRERIDERKNVQPPPAPTASALGPCPTLFQISRTPRHWKFTQHRRIASPDHPLYRKERWIVS